MGQEGRYFACVKRLFFFLTILCALGLQSIFAAKPNILFIMVDDLGKDWISCYGADDIETPHIDRLAKGGLKFHNAWSMPQCTPTRATLLTGQYPWRTGWVNHWDVPRWGVGYFDWAKYTSFAKVMKTAGYATAIAGKWQINDFRIEPKALKKHGFDDWAVWTGYETGNPPSNERYWDAYIHTRSGSKTYKGKCGPDIYCNFLIDFMKQHRDEPMMLYFPMALTHGPLVPTPDERNATSSRDKLKGMVRYTDTLVGRLVAALACAHGFFSSAPGVRYNTQLAASKDKDCQVFVKNLPWKADSQAVREAMERFGTVVEVRLPPLENDANSHRGYGFVTFAAVASARSRVVGRWCS